LVALLALGASCYSTVECSVEESPFGELKVTATSSTTSVSEPTGACVTVTFYDEDGHPISNTGGRVPFSVPTPPGTAGVRVEFCPLSQLVAARRRALRTSSFWFVSLPARLQDRLRFLAATAGGFSHHDAEGLFSRREREWTATPRSPLLTVDVMLEVQTFGSDLLLHITAQDAIQSLELQWNGAPYAGLDDATVSELNGWHTATFVIPAGDVEIPTTVSVENTLHYEMDTAGRSGLSFDASVVLDP
jgi:hypothetical protein